MSLGHRAVSKKWRFSLNEPLLYRVVNVSTCWPKVTNKVVDMLTGRAQWNLRSLNLGMCNKVTDSALKAVVKNGCTNLTSLNLVRNHVLFWTAFATSFFDTGPISSRVTAASP